MKTCKRAAALVLACLLALSLAACHQPGETVMTIGDVTISSGLYLAMQMDAFSQLSSDLQSTLESGESLTTPADVMKKSYEDKDAATWIQDKTLTNAKRYAAILTLFNEAGLELSESDESNLQMTVDYYWGEDYYNMQSYYIPNGVSKESFAELMRSGSRESALFLHYYDKDGVEPVADEELVQGMKDNYLLADSLTIAKTTTDDSGISVTKPDEDLAAAKNKLDGYAARINGGAAFADVYQEYNTELNADFTMPDAESATSQLNPLASVISSSDTTRYELFKSVESKEDFAYGKAYVLENDSNYYLVVLRDITADEAYTQNDNYRQNVLSTLKKDEFDQKLTEKGDSLTLTKDEGLIHFYSPYKIHAAS